MAALIAVGGVGGFVGLGLTAVALRDGCGAACAQPTDSVVTASISAAGDAATEPELELPAAAPKKPDGKLQSAETMIAATFEALLVGADGGEAVAAEPAVARPAPSRVAWADPDKEPSALSTRVVKSVRVTPDGQPTISPEVSAYAPVAARAPDFGEAEPVAEIAPAAPVSDVVAPLPAPRSQRPASRPAAVTEVADAGDQPASASNAAAGAWVVGGQGVNVRANPSSSGEKLFALAGGEQVTVSDRQRGWLRVTDDQGRTGWAYSSYLSAVN